MKCLYIHRGSFKGLSLTELIHGMQENDPLKEKLLDRTCHMLCLVLSIYLSPALKRVKVSVFQAAVFFGHAVCANAGFCN